MMKYWHPLLVTLGIVGSTVLPSSAVTAPPPGEASQAALSFRQSLSTAEAVVEESPNTEFALDEILESDWELLAQNSETAETEAESSAEETDSPEEIARREKLAEADRLYQAGEVAEAARLYREAKEPFALEAEAETEQPAAIYEPANLPPGGVVYWREYQTGLAEELESKIFAPLKLLVEQHPEFIPGHIQYAQALAEAEREQEAQLVLQSAIALYPEEAKLLQAKLEADAASERWLEASLAARQFALFNPEHAQAEAFDRLADQYLEEYKSDLRSDMTWNTVGSVITGALSYALTGNLFGPLSAIETTALLLQGESGIGDRYADRLQEQLPLVEDEVVLEYVRGIGNKLASVAGRDEFEYEFYVVLDDRLNAFALPGGKIFIHTGAIQKAASEAELAGLLAHELAHAVLSHGFQLVTQGNLTANVAQFIPYGGTAANLLVLDYSRGMEKEADLLGTRILAAGGYAADGLHNLMATMAEEDRPTPFVWLSTHPDPERRVGYLEEFIVTNEYNRYTYEGITRHQQIQDRVSKLWDEYRESEEYQERERR
ncbi:MAG: M48 family metalloprotease [Cyanophyceae cyanobacterium]